ncbi:hypothetical protein N431DRAFT_493784 [Stipitochalara longipes BDJ]|nr:hypothetical protein N431DRAFT_493784 [Stipitochalara longipes BDJ]
MDPLSALSIAASVVQFVQFSASLVSKTHEIYTSNEGTLSANVQAEAATKLLIDLVDKLRDPPVTDCSFPPAEFQALGDICNECVGISNELLARLDKLRVQDSHNHRKWKSFRQALKSVWSKDGIEAIRKRLAAGKDELDMHLIVSIRNKVYYSSLQQSQAFASLDRRTQLCIQSLLNNRNFLDQKLSDHRNILIENTQYQHTMTRNAIAETSFNQRKPNFTPEEIELRVIDSLRQSLRFPTMVDRREAISQAHAETFKWIFRPPPDDDVPWSNFIQWLECGTNIYWINGKAGSGKSTLMRYILENPLTLEHLRSNGDEVEVLGFFFWNSGSVKQRSQNGLLRSLLFETLQRHPHLSSQLFPNQWAENISARKIVSSSHQDLCVKQAATRF